MALYARVIVDISVEKLNKTFDYRIPAKLRERIHRGSPVEIPFGGRMIKGYVTELSDHTEVAADKLKEIAGIPESGFTVEENLLALAGWMSEHYSVTMNQAIHTVLPVRKKAKPRVEKNYVLAVSAEEAEAFLARYQKRRAPAKARLLRELVTCKSLSSGLVNEALAISPAVVKGLKEDGVLLVEEKRDFRTPGFVRKNTDERVKLNEEQRHACEEIIGDLRMGIRNEYLIRGVTGSGKTEVYMEVMEEVLSQGKSVIFLIPEISLTYQTVMRFYSRFGDCISILNSRLTPGERSDQFERAKSGEVSVMIGPRSALFTPFGNLGLIIMDEEHESSYKSESVPRYHAREVVLKRAEMEGASVILGSATPSVESFDNALKGRFKLLELDHRAREGSRLPTCSVIDMRKEMAAGNRSILSKKLQELMEDRLERQEQTILFLNRRGLSAVTTCRACGFVVTCPHCDVALSQHNNGKMVCHYCGHTEKIPAVCPSCGSSFIGGFKAGTQKIEEMTAARFPGARILRMDHDTTRDRDSCQKILQDFSEGRADILIGTQMIVKGHDFPLVTLVGVLAADISLHSGDFLGAEKTFQLLTQAVGRAGRSSLPGQAVIQTYDPDHYAVQAAKDQNYRAFFDREMAYRRMAMYPPAVEMMMILGTGPDREKLEEAMRLIERRLYKLIRVREEKLLSANPDWGRVPWSAKIVMLGPCEAGIGRIKDIYRRALYLKAADHNLLLACADRVEKMAERDEDMLFRKIQLQFDFNPVSGG